LGPVGGVLLAYYSVTAGRRQSASAEPGTHRVHQRSVNMPESDFEAEILEDEVVIAHVGEGHVYHFPILSNGTVSLHGSRIEANPDAKREARRYLFDAHDAARSAFSRSRA
jgi:hypothetical protein